MAGHDGLLLVSLYFLLLLIGIKELNPNLVAWIKPIAECIRLSGSLFGEGDHGIPGWLRTLR